MLRKNAHFEDLKKIKYRYFLIIFPSVPEQCKTSIIVNAFLAEKNIIW